MCEPCQPAETTCKPCQPEDASAALDDPREIHVTTNAFAISAFLDGGDRQNQICYRCGNAGHLRASCLSYKIRLCVHHERGNCIDPNCTFAHGIQELRTPWKPRCVRVVKQGGKLVSLGCGSTKHTFRRCPLAQELVFL